MNPDLVLVFLAFALMEVKHFLCDFAVRQDGIELKAIYFNRTGLIHAGLHALASIPVFLLFTSSAALIAALAAAELLAHYHFDWLKAWINARKRLDYSDRLYWILFGGDQLAHQLTYVAILAVLVRTASA
jgi:uncharacterized protein DUF3307